MEVFIQPENGSKASIKSVVNTVRFLRTLVLSHLDGSSTELFYPSLHSYKPTFSSSETGHQNYEHWAPGRQKRLVAVGLLLTL
jgi:hypothetical protein